MRVNVDSQVVTDPRFKRLARALGITWYEALGRCLPVWLASYERREPIVAEEDVDIIAERDGFAAALVVAALAERVDGGVRLRGVSERIDFLLAQDDRARRSVEARRASGKDGAQPYAHARPKPSANQGSALAGANSPDLDLSPDPDHDQTPDLDLRAPSRAGGSKSFSVGSQKAEPDQQTLEAFCSVLEETDRKQNRIGASADEFREPTFDADGAHVASADGMTYGEIERRRDAASREASLVQRHPRLAAELSAMAARVAGKSS